MSEETKKDDQTLASISFILGLVLVGAAIFLVKNFDGNSDKVKALKRADIYAQQLIDKGFEVEIDRDMPGRTLASTPSTDSELVQALEGPLGIDPWGYPFHYFVEKQPNTLTGKMVVWSGGPNNKFETIADEIKNSLKQGKNIRFVGDDFGKVIKFKLDPSFANK